MLCNMFGNTKAMSSQANNVHWKSWLLGLGFSNRINIPVSGVVKGQSAL